MNKKLIRHGEFQPIDVDVLKRMIDNIQTREEIYVEKVFEEALKRKGIEFENRVDFLDFVTKRVTGEKRRNQTVYYIDNDEPFLLKKDKNGINWFIETKDFKYNDFKVVYELPYEFYYIK